MMLAQMPIEWALSSALLILAVTALRALLGKRVSAGLRYALWAVVLVRLLVPVQLFPIFAPAAEPPAPDPAPVVTAAPPALASPPVLSVGQPAIVGPVPDGVWVDYEYNAAPVPPPKTEPLPILQVLGRLWLAGSLVMAAAFAVSNASFARRLRRMRVPLDGADCPLPVYIAQGLPSPCLFGLPRPAVYIAAETAADPVMLRHVLAHEHTHFRHGDHVWNVLRSAALCIHWWDPLVWLAVVLSRRDCELACDEGALKRLGEADRIAYGRTLLALITVEPRPGDLLRCATTMTAGQKSIFERVSRIARAPKRWLWAAVVMVLTAALACVCAFGAAAEPETADEPEPSPESSASAPASVPPEQSEPVLEDPVGPPPAEGQPAVNYYPTVFGGGLDFELFDAARQCPVRFSNLSWAIASTTEFAFQVERYVILDLDRDGDTELVLELGGQGGFYILRRMEGGLYGFSVVPRGLMDLKADGTFEGSSGAFDWGFSRATGFDGRYMTKERFTWCESSWEDDLYEELYFVDGAPAAEEEFWAAVDAQDRKADAPWRPWSGELGYPEEAKAWLDPSVTDWLDPVELPQVAAVSGPDGNWELSYQGKRTRFSGGWNGYGVGAPIAYLLDLDKDGRDEIALTLVDDSVPTERLYLFDAETLERYDTSGVADMVRGCLTITSDSTHHYISAPDFGFDTTVPRGLAVAWEDKARDSLEFFEFVYYPIYLDAGEIACLLSSPVGKIYGHLTLEGDRLACTGFEFTAYEGQPTFADVLLWGVPFLFFGEDGSGYLADAADIPALFNDDPYTKVWRFAVVDLDQDGLDEMVLQVSGVAGDMGGYLVLYKQWGGISGFKSGWRTFWDLKTDGTFQWSSPTGEDHGYGSYWDLYSGELWELSRMHSSWGEPDAEFVIEGIPATEEEYREYDEQQRAKPDAAWYDFTPEDIEALFPS